uniref:JmjC domain-containing protein n=1 Tax=Timema monikensis TaxID=170555 RepID=A0A7R9ECV6_9NEOP|nr:unnamed protein product [Timema monikensis]
MSRKTLSDNKVTVAVTPNGYADAIATRSEQNVDIEYFVMPEEREMNMSEFLDALEDRHKYPGVFYVQRQNSNLTEDFPELMREVEPEISWASEAFGCPPEAVNLWVGDERAITSKMSVTDPCGKMTSSPEVELSRSGNARFALDLGISGPDMDHFCPDMIFPLVHKDPYENIYCVVSGYKDFILLPPTDRPWIPYKSFPVASYKEVAPGHFEIVPRSDKGSASRQTGTPQPPHQLQTAADEDELLSTDDSFVPWICIDPLKPDLDSYPLFKKAHPVTVRVEAGDALYLPSLWYHHVRQSHACIAVNYWYDMQYDIKYAYSQLLEALVKKCHI